MRSEQLIERAGPALLALVAPTVMLAVDPGGWFPFGPAKWLAVATLVPAGAALVLARRPVRVPRQGGVVLVVLLATLSIGAALGEDPLYAWIGTPERHLGVLGWALCALALVAGASLARPWERVDVIGIGLVVAGVGVGGVGTAEALGWEPAVLDVGDRLTGTFGSSAYLGAATALLLPILVGLAADAGVPRRRRVLAALGVPLLLVTCLGSGARAAWVGLAAATVWWAWERRTSLVRDVRRAAAVVTGAAVVLAAVLVLTPVGPRLVSITDADAPGGQGRLDEWRVAARVIGAHPLAGVGPEGYRVAFAEGVDAGYERDHGREVQPDRAHSGPLDVALAAGFPAVAAWATLVVLVGGAVRRTLRRGSGWEVGIAGALVAHLVGQLILFPIIELEPVAWLLAGLVVATAPAVPRPWVVPRAAAVLLGALAAAGLVAGATEVLADRRAGDAADALARGDHRAAVAHVDSALDLRPDVLRLHLLAARAAVAADEGLHTGIRHLDDALELSPGDPIALRQRAELLVARAAATQVPAHADEARDELRHLLDDDPHNALLWHQAAVLADVTGDRAAFEVAQAHLAELAPDDELAP